MNQINHLIKAFVHGLGSNTKLILHSLILQQSEQATFISKHSQQCVHALWVR